MKIEEKNIGVILNILADVIEDLKTTIMLQNYKIERLEKQISEHEATDSNPADEVEKATVIQSDE